MVHDEDEKCLVGDIVTVRKTPKISKHKSHVVDRCAAAAPPRRAPRPC